jgi:hypothetical protein
MAKKLKLIIKKEQNRKVQSAGSVTSSIFPNSERALAKIAIPLFVQTY